MIWVIAVTAAMVAAAVLWWPGEPLGAAESDTRAAMCRVRARDDSRAG